MASSLLAPPVRGEISPFARHRDQIRSALNVFHQHCSAPAATRASCVVQISVEKTPQPPKPDSAQSQDMALSHLKLPRKFLSRSPLGMFVEGVPVTSWTFTIISTLAIDRYVASAQELSCQTGRYPWALNSTSAPPPHHSAVEQHRLQCKQDYRVGPSIPKNTPRRHSLRKQVPFFRVSRMV